MAEIKKSTKKKDSKEYKSSKKTRNSNKRVDKKIIEESSSQLQEKKKKPKQAISDKRSIKNFFTSSSFLIGIFLFLFLLVIFLGIMIFLKNKDAKENIHANIVVPVFEIGSNYEFGIDAFLLAKEKKPEYIIKITNYKKDVVNEEKIPYQLTIRNTTSSVVSISKGEDSTNLMKDQESTTLEEDVLLDNEKEDVYYTLKISNYEHLKSKDLIMVQITS